MNWFFASGDAPFFYQDQLDNLSFFPKIWIDNEGFGQSAIPRLWIDYPFQLITFLLSRLGLSWFYIDKFWWFGAILIALFSSYKLGLYLFKRQYKAILFTIFYCFNTYTVMIFSGGQLGVFLAYGYFPFVLYLFNTYIDRLDFRLSLRLGLLLSLLIMMDLRTFFIALPLLCFIYMFKLFKRIVMWNNIIFVVLIVIMLIHSFWVLPVLTNPSVSRTYSQINASSSSLSFFSFADFSHAFSLLHPNWPENLFGRVSFFKVEFLLIPMIGFISILTGKKRNIVLLSVLLVLLGAFLAKGTNEPFGYVNQFLFNYIPGFNLFRDPTKWYIYIALGYSILLSTVFSTLSVQKRLLLLFAFLIILYKPLIAGKVQGNIKPIGISKETTLLADYIKNYPSSRVLWLPTKEQFAYQSPQHPSLIALDVFPESSPAGISRHIQNREYQNKINELSIGLIIVPPDYRKRIFLNNYEHDVSERLLLIDSLKTNGFVKETKFLEYDVFFVQDYKIFSVSDIHNQNIQNIVNIGLFISVFTLAVCIIFNFRKL